MTNDNNENMSDIFAGLRKILDEYNAAKAKIPLQPEYLSGHPQYPQYCEEFLSYRDTWSIAEAINLLIGCLPTRPLLMKGQDQINRSANHLKNRVIACAGESLGIINPDSDFDEWRVLRREILRWAREKQIRIPDELNRAEVEDQPLSEFSYKGYTTKSLQILGDVIENFWVNFDEEDRSTHHKQTVIIDWLRSKFGISENIARAIDSIARPESLKKGGQSKINDA